MAPEPAEDDRAGAAAGGRAAVVPLVVGLAAMALSLLVTGLGILSVEHAAAWAVAVGVAAAVGTRAVLLAGSRGRR